MLCAHHGWLALLPPEGASAILYHETDRAPRSRGSQGVTSADLLDAGIVDVVVPEHPDAADEPDAFCDRMADAIATAWSRCTDVPLSGGIQNACPAIGTSACH